MNIRKMIFLCVTLSVTLSGCILSIPGDTFTGLTSSGGQKTVVSGASAAWAGSSGLVQRRESPTEKKKVIMPSFIRRGINALVGYQRDIRTRMASLAKSSNSGQDPAGLILLFLLSFLYGAVHAVGPGHGKVALSSFVMLPGVGIARGMILGVVIAIFHGISALVLVLLTLSGIHRFNLNSMDSIDILQRVSAFLLIILGMFMFLRFLYRIKAEKTDEVSPVESGRSSSSSLVFALMVGLVPCSGIVILVLFINAAGLWRLGVPMVVSMIAGMGLTLSLTGAIMVLLRKGVFLPFLSEGGEAKSGAGAIMVQLISPILLVLAGILLF